MALWSALHQSSCDQGISSTGPFLCNKFALHEAWRSCWLWLPSHQSLLARNLLHWARKHIVRHYCSFNSLPPQDTVTQTYMLSNKDQCNKDQYPGHACFTSEESDIFIHSFIHLFIHIEHLYSASSRKLLRSATNTSTVKQSSIVRHYFVLLLTQPHSKHSYIALSWHDWITATRYSMVFRSVPESTIPHSFL